jgi:hypothetical protein
VRCGSQRATGAAHDAEAEEQVSACQGLGAGEKPTRLDTRLAARAWLRYLFTTWKEKWEQEWELEQLWRL